MKRTNDVSKLTGVSKRTLQYYDDTGLLHLKRSGHNHRLFDQSSLKTIWEILIYKEMGFQLNEIKELLDSSDEQKQLLFDQQVINLKSQIEKLHIQIHFILMVREHGIPEVPTTNEYPYTDILKKL